MNQKPFIEKKHYFQCGGFLDWNTRQKKFDKAKVFDFMKKFPGQIREAVEIADSFETLENSSISNIVFCGMGGSGIGGRIVKKIVQKEIKVPIEIIANYSLPEFVNGNTLVVTVSFSGNTEETIACAEEAQRKGAKLVAIVNSGKISQIAKEKIVVPKAPQPRMALGYLSTALFFVLSKYGLIADKKKELLDCSDFLKKEQPALEREAKKIAQKLKGKFPVIYAESSFEAVAYRFRCEFNENAKILAVHQEIPEMNHNEINSEILPKNSCIILLRSRNESEKIKKRFEFSKKVFKKYSQIEIWFKGKNVIEETFCGIFLTDLATYYLSLLNKKDPNEIPVIGKLKEELKKP